MVKKTIPLLFHAIAGKGSRSNPMLARIIISDHHTQVDFAYQAYEMYVRGGWIRIASYTHIKVEGITRKFALIEAVGIPIAPQRLDFESKADWQYFTLYFEPIPFKDGVLNIIEEEDPAPTDFNFYQIKIKIKEGIPVIV